MCIRDRSYTEYKTNRNRNTTQHSKTDRDNKNIAMKSQCHTLYAVLSTLSTLWSIKVQWSHSVTLCLYAVLSTLSTLLSIKARAPIDDCNRFLPPTKRRGNCFSRIGLYVCLSVCLSVCNGLTFESLDTAGKFIFGTYVHVHNLQFFKFVHKGHLVNVKVTGGKKSVCTSMSQAFAIWSRWIVVAAELRTQCGVLNDSVARWRRTLVWI